MAKDLTALSVERAKASSTRQEIPDGHTRGLFLIVQPTGRKSWAFRYRNTDRQTRKLTLGAFPGVSLEQARKLAAKAKSAVADKFDPAAERAAARKTAAAPEEPKLVENVVKQFIERHAKANTREATWRESERILENEIVQRWRGQPISAIRKSDIHALLDRIIDRGAPIAANRYLEAMRPMFRWAVDREYITASPCDGVKPPSAAVTRDRFLADPELRRAWQAAEAMGYPFGSIVQLLILSGQRRDEVAGMSWSELDLSAGLWTIPADRAKNKKPHTVHLPAQAIAILESLARFHGSDLVFTTNGTTHVSGFGRAKDRLDRLIATDAAPMEPWTFHDLRRTLATGCAAMGVAPQVVEAILNHKAGVIRGVAAVYNRYDHGPERRAALAQWARHVEAVVAGAPASNVIELRTAI